MKKFIALILSLAVALPLLLSCESSGTPAESGTVTDSKTVTTEKIDPVSIDPATDIFVSADGNDETADGSMEKPYGSIQAAQEAVRTMKKNTDKPITVWLRGGDYLFTQTVGFGEEDAGTEDAPITYSAWNGEEVRFIGGLKVAPSLISSAADSEIAKRMLDSSKAKELLVIDMSTLCDNPASLPDFWCNYPGHAHWGSTRGDIYIGNSGLKRAR